MAIDNVLLLVLVPWTGPASDRLVALGRSRLPFVIAGLVLAAAGMALLPPSASLGLGVLIAAMVLLHAGINMQRSPFHALMADVVPSRFRSLANASVTFQMCVAAIVFLMLGRMLGMRLAFFIAAGTVLVIALAFVAGMPTAMERAQSEEPTFASLGHAAWEALSGRIAGMRAIFAAALLLQLTFQTFTTWYALHAIERFGITAEDVTIGFIAWAIGGVIGALPAGFVGMRLGRRATMLGGFAGMAICLLALDRAATQQAAVPLIGLTSAIWAFPMVNAYPLFIERVAPSNRGILTSVFLLSMALGGAVGDPVNGRLFDAFAGYRPMFLLMCAYTTLAVLAVWLIPRGAGEARDV
jgi:predicted MFS family arabinose efflux permease